jgi:[FeFe] hydrogenase H-cluster maturation GTPase HydF
MSSLNETPRGERLHIGIFGRMGAGKSSLLNAITGQDIAVVSPVKGTTTDPVSKAMEILPIGPVLLIDTAGIDDSGELGGLRISKTKEVLRKTDVALIVVDAREGLCSEDRRLIDIFKEASIPYLIVYNKSDLASERVPSDGLSDGLYISCMTGENIELLKNMLAEIGKNRYDDSGLVSDIINPGDVIVLVVPVDKAAPKGRLILPQQQVIRDILDEGAISIITRDNDFAETLKKLKAPPRMVITDSQVFGKIAKETPDDIRLTSFSILMARHKGVLRSAVQGAKALDSINDGDRLLISEGCTHHRQCEDIGTVKLPRMIEKHTGTKPVYEFSSGGGFPDDLSGFKLIIHCGGCMLNRREMIYRERLATEANIPITNYGVAMSYMQGILARCAEGLL